MTVLEQLQALSQQLGYTLLPPVEQRTTVPQEISSPAVLVVPNVSKMRPESRTATRTSLKKKQVHHQIAAVVDGELRRETRRRATGRNDRFRKKRTKVQIHQATVVPSRA